MLKRTLTVIASIVALLVAGLAVPQGVQAGEFPVAYAPGAIAWSPDGQYAYFGPGDAHNSPSTPRWIKRLDLSTGLVSDFVTLNDTCGGMGYAGALAVTPDNSNLLVAGFSCAFTVPIANPNAFTATVTGFDWGTGVVIGTDVAYATGTRNGIVFKLAKTNGTWGTSWTQLNNVEDSSVLSRSLALSPDGSTLYTGNEGNPVRVIHDPNAFIPTVTALADSGPAFGMAVAPDGSYLLVTDGGRVVKKVMLTGPTAGTVTSLTYWDDWGMRKIVIDPTGTYAYIAAIFGNHTLVKIHTSDLTVESRLDLTQTYPTLTGGDNTPNDLAPSPSALRPNAADEVLLSLYPLSTILQLPSAPGAPTSLNALPADDSATVSFTAPAIGSGITNYEYRIDGTGAWTALSPADTTSPVTVPGLTNGVPAGIELRAVNAQGSGSASASVTVTPQSTPRAPRNVVGTPSAGQLSIDFTVPESDGGFPITNYEVSTDNGQTWTTPNPAITTGPIVVTGLTNGVQYLVSVRAVNALGSGTGSTPIGVTPNLPNSGPSSSRNPEPTPTPTPSATAAPEAPATTTPPSQVAVPEPVALGEGLVVVDGRVLKVAVKSLNRQTWQVEGDGFALAFTPKAVNGNLDDTFSARAGGQIVVSGSGYLPGSLVAAYLPGSLAAPLGQATVNADGTFEVTATIPEGLAIGSLVFQLNGLSTSTSVRSVNLGMNLLPPVRMASKVPTMQVQFTPGSTEISGSVAKGLASFVRKNDGKRKTALIVPSVRAGASSQQAALVRAQARQLSSALREEGFDGDIRVAPKVRRITDPSQTPGVRLWVRTT